MSKDRTSYIFKKKCLLILLYLYYINDVSYKDITFRSFGFHFEQTTNFKVYVTSKNKNLHKYSVQIFDSLKGVNLETLDIMGNVNIVKVNKVSNYKDFYQPKSSLNIFFDEISFYAEGYIEGKHLKYELEQKDDSVFKDDILHNLVYTASQVKGGKDKNFLIWVLKLYTYKLPTDLVLGAGINCDYGAKDWKGLISSLDEEFYEGNARAVQESKKYVGEELFVSSKVLKSNGFDVYKSLNRELYLFKEAKSFNDEDSTLYQCVLYLEKHKGANVITYNYDTNLEYLLRKKNILYTSVYDENSFLTEKCVCNIFHVHGVLPFDKYNEKKYTDSLVFSESEYFELYNNPYTWNISKQLHDFRFNTCLFIGISLTDPNMKRLLELSNNLLKFNFIFIKTEKDFLESTYKDLTNYYFTYDLIPLWIEEYSEIGKILSLI